MGNPIRPDAIDPRVINACHRALDHTNRTGRRAYVVFCTSAQRYEALTDLPSMDLLAADYRYVAESEVD